MAKLLVAFVAVIVVAAVCTAQETCGENQVFNPCGTACPKYCHRGNKPVVCTKQCVIGCECAPGYVKEYIDSDRCVLETRCNRAQKCEKNKTFHICGSACPAYCGQPQDVPCTRNCVPECQCAPGYVYKSKNSTECIPFWECPE